MVKNRMSKIALSIAVSAIAIFGLNGCNKTNKNSAKGLSEYEIAADIPIGSKDAKVVLVEYASIACPHCATFQKDIVPTIMEKYVKTNKIRYVFREYPTGNVQLASAGHLLLRCNAPEKREALLNTLFEQQMEIFNAAQSAAGPKQALLNIAKSAGMSEADFDKCMENSELLQTLVDLRNYGNETDKISGTPTVFVNGKLVEQPVGSEYKVEDITKALDAALAK